ncbi:hypothetical protein [Nocardioides sp. NPDC004968]|uniref:hypothetical protein n=1 Tax=Nocardioides sp. NPDC004968 TaxID=3155894 RepID=UPI0033A94D5D
MRNRALAADRIVDLHFAFGDVFRLARLEVWEPGAVALGNRSTVVVGVEQYADR